MRPRRRRESRPRSRSGAEGAGQSSSSATPSCSTVRMPSASSLRAVLEPTPQSSLVGWPAITSSQFDRVSSNTPRGLANPEARLAPSLLSPTPIEHQRRVWDRTARWISRARADGSLASVSRNASSHPATSPTASKLRSVAITDREAASPASASTGRNTACGHCLYAVRSGIAEWTPNLRAS